MGCLLQAVVVVVLCGSAVAIRTPTQNVEPELDAQLEAQLPESIIQSRHLLQQHLVDNSNLDGVYADCSFTQENLDYTLNQVKNAQVRDQERVEFSHLNEPPQELKTKTVRRYKLSRV